LFDLPNMHRRLIVRHATLVELERPCVPHVSAAVRLRVVLGHKETFARGTSPDGRPSGEKVVQLEKEAVGQSRRRQAETERLSESVAHDLRGEPDAAAVDLVEERFEPDQRNGSVEVGGLRERMEIVP
jgi:hypothetical protein